MPINLNTVNLSTVPSQTTSGQYASPQNQGKLAGRNFSSSSSQGFFPFSISKALKFGFSLLGVFSPGAYAQTVSPTLSLSVNGGSDLCSDLYAGQYDLAGRVCFDTDRRCCINKPLSHRDHRGNRGN